MIGNLDDGRVGALLGRLCRDAGVPGMALTVRTKDQRVDVAVGHRDPSASEALDVEASFELGCVAKPLLAASAVRLARLGRIGLDHGIGRYLPELAATAYGREVDIAHLLTHSTGFMGTGRLEDPDALGWPALIGHLARAPRLFVPGAVFSYEHSDTVVLGRILNQQAKAGLKALIERLVLEPAGVAADSDASAGRHGIGAHGRCARIARAARPDSLWRPGFAIALSMPRLASVAMSLCAGEGGMLAAMLDRSLALPPMVRGPACPELPIGFALGLARFHGGWLGANGVGNGQSVALRLHPDRQVVFALGINALAPRLRDRLVAALCRDCVPGPSDVEPAIGLPLDGFVGSYIGAGGGFVQARGSARALELEIRSRRVQGWLWARLTRSKTRLSLETAVPTLAVGLAASARRRPWLMLGLTAFARLPVSRASRDFEAFHDRRL